MANISLVFNAVLKNIQKHISEKEFSMWFSLIKPKSLQNNIFILSVPSSFFKDAIEKKYTQQLYTIAHEEKIECIKIEVDDFVLQTISNNTDAAVFSKMSEIDKKQKTKTDKKVPGALNKNFTFNYFIVGTSNNFAASTAKAIANNPGQAYNPCLMYGSVGLGKTHLLQAIGNEIIKQNPKAKVLYITSEQFLKSFVESMQNNNPQSFERKMRTPDVLLVDDIQFFSKKEGMQEQMFHTFNVLSDSDKQMVFTSDRPISQINDLQERLASRFQSGTSVDLQPPTMEMALGIMKNALIKNNVTDLVSDDILEFISQHMRNNIRDMLAFLNRIVGYKQMTKNEITLLLLKKWVNDHKPKVDNFPHDTVLRATASYFTVSIADIKSKKRTRDIARVRHIAMFLLRKHTNLTFTEIGKLMNVSHVAATRADSTIKKEIEVGEKASEIVSEIENQINMF